MREALERAKAYAGAGANGIYPIGLADPALIGAFCAGSPLPVNIYGMAGPAAELAAWVPPGSASGHARSGR